MSRFIKGCDRQQKLLLPDCVDDYVGEDSTVRVVDVFVDELDLGALGFEGAAATGRPGYHPCTLLKLYLYGYLNQVQSSRRLEREAGRNVECMWLTGKLAHRRLPPRQWCSDPVGVPSVHHALPRARAHCRWHGGRGREPLQGGEHA